MTKSFVRVSVLFLVVLTGAAVANAALPTVSLGNNSFAVSAGSTITNTGSSVLNGDVALSPGTAVTGFPPGTIHGVQHVADATASQFQTTVANAYTDASNRTPVSTIPTQLGGSVQNPGVYNSADGTFGITGTLTLDAKGDPNAVFIFKTSSTLTTAGASTIVLANGAQACNVFWQVGSSATLGTNSTFKGNILALTSATLTTGANVEGGVFARNGAVTLDSNVVTRATCNAQPTPTPTPTPVVSTTTPTVVAPVATTTTAAVASTTTMTPTLPKVPSLPNTGYGPDSTNAIWLAAMLAGGFGLLYSVAVLRRKTTKAF